MRSSSVGQNLKDVWKAELGKHSSEWNTDNIELRSCQGSRMSCWYKYWMETDINSWIFQGLLSCLCACNKDEFH